MSGTMGGNMGRRDQNQLNSSNTVFIQRRSCGEEISVGLTEGDFANKKMDLNAFKELCASKLNLVKDSIKIYNASGRISIQSQIQFQNTVDRGKKNNTATRFLCDGVVITDSLTPSKRVFSAPDHDAKVSPDAASTVVNHSVEVQSTSVINVEYKKLPVTVEQAALAASAVTDVQGRNFQELSAETAEASEATFGVIVDHMELKKRAKFKVRADITIKEFKKKIYSTFKLDAASFSVFYSESEYRVEVMDDEALREAIKETQSFHIEKSITGSTSVELASDIGNVDVDKSPVDASAVSASFGDQHFKGVSMESTGMSKKISVTVEHAESNQSHQIEVDHDLAFSKFEKKISQRTNFDPSWTSVFYDDLGSRVKVEDDESLQEALAKTNSFSIECSIFVSVMYESITYAVELHSTTMDELKRQLCKEFALNRHEFDSMEIVHESMVIIGLKYYQSILRSYCRREKLAEFTVRPKISSSKPSSIALTSVNSNLSSSPNSTAKDSYDVEELEGYHPQNPRQIDFSRLRVWLDENEMRANMYEQMAEAITRSLVITPLLTVAYSRSANCKRELPYAADIKKHIEPTRDLQQHKKLESWAELITAGMIYYDFSNTLTDDKKFNKSFDALYTAIRHGMEIKVAPPPIMNPVDPLYKWLRPVNFTNDLARFEKDYVPGTRTWAVHDVHRWLQEGLKYFLWLNGGAGLGKSVIAYLVSQNLPFGFTLGSAFFCKHDDIVG
ncbi:hypothetical protein HDU76_007490, partial [Blyttiomyces sp. JEL0837]